MAEQQSLEQAQTEEPRPDESSGAPTAAAGADVAATEQADPLAACRREVEQLRDKNLRLMAEARNLQQRAMREKQEALKFAESEFARELLVVLDDFERTIESAKSAQEPKTVAEGVQIVYDHFMKVLRSRSIEPIEAVGQSFDPTYHEALLQQPSDTVPSGVVLQDIARGYRMHDRVLRPSRVIVSSGPANAKQA